MERETTFQPFGGKEYKAVISKSKDFAISIPELDIRGSGATLKEAVAMLVR